MYSVVLPVRNLRESAHQCLGTMLASFQTLGIDGQTEYILVDDDSDPAGGVLDLFRQFKASVQSPCTIAHVKRRQYYVYAASIGLSLARGESIFLFCHDLVIPPRFISTLMSAAVRDPTFGIVRGTSSHIDCFPQHVITPPMPMRTFDDVCNFSNSVGDKYGDTIEEDRFLMSDSVLIKRAVLDKVGVMDTSYRHLFGDIDWGLRTQRAGFKLVCAKGAWILHDGNAHTRTLLASGVTEKELADESRALVIENYGKFRNKWGNMLPPDYPGAAAIDYKSLRGLPKTFDEFIPPMKIDPDLCEIF